VIRTLYRLAKHARYRPLPVGGHLLVDSIADLQRSVRGVVGKWDATWLQPSEETATITLCKYGIVDVELAAPRALLDHPDTESGLAMLRANWLLPKRGEPRDAEDAPLVKAIVGDFDPSACFLKLMLRDDIDDRIHELWLRQQITQKPVVLALPDGYFPRDLTVIDACITNADFIWAAKHFYL
jgi:hypothetical protein